MDKAIEIMTAQISFDFSCLKDIIFELEAADNNLTIRNNKIFEKLYDWQRQEGGTPEIDFTYLDNQLLAFVDCAQKYHADILNAVNNYYSIRQMFLSDYAKRRKAIIDAMKAQK